MNDLVVAKQHFSYGQNLEIKSLSCLKTWNISIYKNDPLPTLEKQQGIWWLRAPLRDGCAYYPLGDNEEQAREILSAVQTTRSK